MIYEHTCERCGKEFKNNNVVQKFCSRYCYSPNTTRGLTLKKQKLQDRLEQVENEIQDIRDDKLGRLLSEKENIEKELYEN